MLSITPQENQYRCDPVYPVMLLPDCASVSSNLRGISTEHLMLAACVRQSVNHLVSAKEKSDQRQTIALQLVSPCLLKQYGGHCVAGLLLAGFARA